MSRIRSVHPGLWTDESFVALSPLARLFFIGIWTECDDHGVFEWKPIVLKMRLLPAESIDAAALAEELRAADAVAKFDAGGKQYGIVRNFCRFQRPKKPAYKFPFPPEWGTYVGLETDGSPSVPHQSPTEGEIPPQMEDGGGKKEEKEKKKSFRAVAKATRPSVGEKFEEFWKAYPRRDGANPKAPAEKLFSAAVRAGAPPGEIINGARRCAEKERDKIGTPYIPQAVKWLRDRRWEDYPPEIETPSVHGPPSPDMPSDEELRKRYGGGDGRNEAQDCQPDRPEILERCHGPCRENNPGGDQRPNASDDPQGIAGVPGLAGVFRGNGLDAGSHEMGEQRRHAGGNGPRSLASVVRRVIL